MVAECEVSTKRFKCKCLKRVLEKINAEQIFLNIELVFSISSKILLLTSRTARVKHWHMNVASNERDKRNLPEIQFFSPIPKIRRIHDEKKNYCRKFSLRNLDIDGIERDIGVILG